MSGNYRAPVTTDVGGVYGFPGAFTMARHLRLFRLVHGTPPTEGTLPGEVWMTSLVPGPLGAAVGWAPPATFGDKLGTHLPVYISAVSPAAQAARFWLGGLGADIATTATAGAAMVAIPNPPARINARAGLRKFAIGPLSASSLVKG